MSDKTSGKIIFKRIFLIVIAIAIGIATIAFFVSKKQPPQKVEVAEIQRSVQVIVAKKLPLFIEATGFGTAMPAKSFSAISNVKGHVIYRRDDLESGAIIAKGTLLLEIDSKFYQLALQEADAEIASVDAEIAQLKQEAINSKALLDLEQQRLELAETDLERTKKLVASGSISKAALDTQLRATLLQRKAVQTLANQQNIIPIQQARLDAQKQRVLSKQAQVESDLLDTKIYAPFDIRISEVKVEEYQYINPGQILFSGDDIKFSEIILQVPMHSLRRLLSELPKGEGGMDVSLLDAYVQLVGESQKWDAKVIRIANGIDPATRTIQVVLSVEQPKDSLSFLENPPLPKGMYVEGVLKLVAKEKQLLVPQNAVHQGWLYLVDENNRLERREVEIDFQQNGMAVISSGIEEGEIIIIDDIVPAISGTLLDAKNNEQVEQSLKAKAMGDVKGETL